MASDAVESGAGTVVLHQLLLLLVHLRPLHAAVSCTPCCYQPYPFRRQPTTGCQGEAKCLVPCTVWVGCGLGFAGYRQVAAPSVLTNPLAVLLLQQCQQLSPGICQGRGGMWGEALCCLRHTGQGGSRFYHAGECGFSVAGTVRLPAHGFIGSAGLRCGCGAGRLRTACEGRFRLLKLGVCLCLCALQLGLGPATLGVWIGSMQQRVELLSPAGLDFSKCSSSGGLASRGFAQSAHWSPCCCSAVRWFLSASRLDTGKCLDAAATVVAAFLVCVVTSPDATCVWPLLCTGQLQVWFAGDSLWQRHAAGTLGGGATCLPPPCCLCSCWWPIPCTWSRTACSLFCMQPSDWQQ